MSNAKTLIIGLGNPGEKYKNTRHNVGKEFVEKLKDDLPKDFLIAETNCYMNESGKDVKKLADYYKVASGDLIIVHDDLDLPLGTVRISFASSAAGHKGVESIIKALKTEDFWRVRIGVGRPPENISAEDYVLQKFSKEEIKKLQTGMDKIKDNMVELESKTIYI